MSQGEFTKSEAERTREAVREIWEGIPKTRRMAYLGHLNDIYLFLDAAKYHAVDDETPPALQGPDKDFIPAGSNDDSPPRDYGESFANDTNQGG